MNAITEAKLKAEKQYVIDALMRCAGNIFAAAREARIDRSNFRRIMRRHRISVVREGDVEGIVTG